MRLVLFRPSPLLMRVLLVAAIVAAALLLLVAGAAGAADVSPGPANEVTERGIADVLGDLAKNPAVWVTLITVILIPVLNSLLTAVGTVPGFKGLVTAVLAGVYAVVAWLTELGDAVVNWETALLVFIIAMGGAGGFNAAVFKDSRLDDVLQASGPQIGPKMTPDRAHQLHDHGGKAGMEAPPRPGEGAEWNTPPDPLAP